MRSRAILLTFILSITGGSLFAQAPRPPKPKPVEKATPPDIAPERNNFCEEFRQKLSQHQSYTLAEYNAYAAACPNSQNRQEEKQQAGQNAAPSHTEKLTIPWSDDAPCIAMALDTDVQIGLAQKIGISPSNAQLKDVVFTSCIAAKLRKNRFTTPMFQLNIIHTSEVNASADPARNIITMNDALLRFMDYNEDEIAAVMAHEMGHLQDYRTPVSAGGVTCVPGAEMQTWKLQECEKKADYLGLQYLLGAGYNGFGMAGELGRFLVYQGDTGLRGFLTRFTSDHPINIDRLKAVRKEWLELCEQNSVACQGVVP